MLIVCKDWFLLVSIAPHIDCGPVQSKDVQSTMLSETYVDEEGKLVTTVSCVEGYLLVPQNGSVVPCDFETGDWTFPECQGTCRVG